MKDVNFDLQCPFRVGHYDILNFTVHVPPIVPLPKNVNFCLKLRYISRSTNEKKMSYFGNLTAFMSYNYPNTTYVKPRLP